MVQRTHLLLSYDFPPMEGGIARWMGELARRYPEGSLIVSTGRQPHDDAAEREVRDRVDRLPVGAARLRTLQGVVRWSRRAAKLARAHRTEFVWCGNVKPAGYPARWVRSRLGVPYGIMVHGGDLLILQRQVRTSPVKRRIARGLLGQAAVMIANSKWTADLCRTTLDQLDLTRNSSKVRTVPLGTDPTLFRPGVDQEQIQAHYGINRGRWLLTVARLTEHKGIDTAIRTLALLRAEYPDLGYLVVGSGEDLGRLKSLAIDLGLSERVRFLSGVPDHLLPAAYNAAEVYLGLSRPMPERVEGFGISLLEASACGIPVIGSRAGGIPDAIREGETGLLVNPESLEDICNAVRRLLEDSGLKTRLGQAGRRAVESYYNWDRVAADLFRIGRELAAPASRELMVS